MKMTYGALDVTAYPFAVLWGTDTGAPQNVTEALAFLLQDGEVELSDRASNRTMQFTVLVEGATLGECATNEATLIGESEKVRNTIALDPEDGGPVTVYETFRAQVVHARDDDGELSRLRLYTVTIKALPFVRSEDEVTSVALPTSGSTTTLLDAMSTTTGWTGTANGASATVTNSSGANSVSLVSASVGVNRVHTLTMSKTFAATTSVTSLLVVDWQSSPFGGAFRATGDGMTLPLIAEQASPTAGYVRSYFKVAAPSLAVTTFTWTINQPASSSPIAPTYRVSIDNVAVTNVFGAGRQQLHSLEVAGSTRAPGRLAVESSTAALGDALVYVFPTTDETSGYSPAMRQFRFSGLTPTVNSAMVSGASEAINGTGSNQFRVPVGLLPRGQYIVMGRLSAGSPISTTLVIQAQTIMGGSLGSQFLSSTVSLTTTMTIHVLGRLSLPTVDLDSFSTASLSLIVMNSDGAIYDEFWLFNTTIGQLIWVDCGTGSGSVGGSARRLFIEAPMVATPRPTVRVGHSADRSDSFHPVGSVKAWQMPTFTPPQVSLHVVTPNATDAAVTYRYWPNWHTHAGS